MIYVFDTSSFIVLGHYFPSQFPSFWDHFNTAVADGQILSVREVYRELDNQSSRPHLRTWTEENKSIFLVPTPEELAFVRRVFAVGHFRQLVSEKQRLKGSPVADPFVVAAAAFKKGCVVTEEVRKDHAAKIPNVCEHFSIECTNLEGVMAREGWVY
jgi:hypothetical protein